MPGQTPPKQRIRVLLGKKKGRKNGDQVWELKGGRSRDVTVPKDQLGKPRSAAPSSLASKPPQILTVGATGELRILIPASSKAGICWHTNPRAMGKPLGSCRMKDPNTQKCETSVLLRKDREQEIPSGLLQGLPRKQLFLLFYYFYF